MVDPDDVKPTSAVLRVLIAVGALASGALLLELVFNG